MPSQESRKQAAIATLGSLGNGLSQFKSFRPSVISPKDISAKPLPQKQLGQRENNRFLQQTELLKGQLGGNVNKLASSVDVNPYILSSSVKIPYSSVPAYTEQPYTIHSGDVSTTKQADLSSLASKLQAYVPKETVESSKKLIDASKGLYNAVAQGFKPEAAKESIFTQLGRQAAGAVSGAGDKISGGIDKLRGLLSTGSTTPQSLSPTPAPTPSPTPAPTTLPTLAGPPVSLANPALSPLKPSSPATVFEAGVLGSAQPKPSPLLASPTERPNPLARADLSPATVASDYAASSPNYDPNTKTYDPDALNAFISHHNKLNPTKPIDTFTAPYYLDDLQSKFGPRDQAPGNVSLADRLNADANSPLTGFKDRPLAEYAHGMNLINMHTPMDAQGNLTLPQDRAMMYAKGSPYLEAQTANYNLKNQQMANHFSKLAPEQQSIAVLNMPYSRKVDTIDMLRASGDPNSIAIADRIKSLDDSIFTQHAKNLGSTSMPQFMAGRPVSLMTVLGNTADSRTFDERVRLLSPEDKGKVKALPPGILSRLRYTADVATGNGQASAAVNSADAYRQQEVGQSDSAWQNLRERAGIGSMAPVGDAVDAVRAMNPVAIANRETTNKTLGDLNNYGDVIRSGNAIADKSQRIQGYNESIRAAIASGDQERINKIPELMKARNEALGIVNTVSSNLTNELSMDSPSAMSQAMSTPDGRGSRATALASAALSDLNPYTALSRMLGRGAVYSAEGGSGLGQYINNNNRDVYGDLLGMLMLPGVGSASKRVGGSFQRGSQAALDRLAKIKALGTTPVDSLGKGLINLGKGIYRPSGYDLADLAFPAGNIISQPKIREAIAKLRNSLKPGIKISPAAPQEAASEAALRASNQAGGGMTPLQQALIAGGVSIPAVLALTSTLGSGGSDEAINDDEEADA